MWSSNWVYCRTTKLVRIVSLTIKELLPKYTNFIIKLLSKALPTLSYMRMAYPNYFENDLCPYCHNKENDNHIFNVCHYYQDIRNEMWNNIKLVLHENDILISNWFSNFTQFDPLLFYAGLIPKQIFNVPERTTKVIVPIISKLIVQYSFNIWLKRNDLIYSKKLTYNQRKDITETLNRFLPYDEQILNFYSLNFVKTVASQLCIRQD